MLASASAFASALAWSSSYFLWTMKTLVVSSFLTSRQILIGVVILQERSIVTPFIPVLHLAINLLLFLLRV